MNQRQITKILRESVFAPNKSGLMRVITDVGSIDYYLNRAIEAIKRADLKHAPVTGLVPYDREQLTFAISLLALSKAQIDEQNQKRLSGNQKM